MKLYFIHVPRTGGNSVNKWITTAKKGVIDIHYDGHARYSGACHERLKAKDKVVAFTMMRDPVELTASFYMYIKGAKPHRGYKDANKWTFSQWIVNSPEPKNFFTRWFNNHTWPQFINPKPADLTPPVDVAVKTLGKFDYIFDTTALTQGMNKMCAEHDIKHRFNVHINKRNKPPISPADVKLIKKVSALDYELIAKAAPHIKLKY